MSPDGRLPGLSLNSRKLLFLASYRPRIVVTWWDCPRIVACLPPRLEPRVAPPFVSLHVLIARQLIHWSPSLLLPKERYFLPLSARVDPSLHSEISLFAPVKRYQMHFLLVRLYYFGRILWLSPRRSSATASARKFRSKVNTRVPTRGTVATAYFSCPYQTTHCARFGI